MVTGTVNLHIMDQQFLAKVSFKKKKITLKNTSLVHAIDVWVWWFFKTGIRYFETLKVLVHNLDLQKKK